jgi:FtsP/CotA-like multicopper oxidase with cupredoxin domain
MPPGDDRRDFLKRSTLAAAGLLAAGTAAAAGQEGKVESQPENDVKDEYDGFSRLKPSRGNNPDSPYYLGKQVPGYRPRSAGPAPFVALDLEPLPFQMQNGAKEFHLVCQPVKREFLPGYKMNVYGFNGSMPGPTIEVTQGDRVRIVVTNELTEDTVIHWHGFELPVQYDGSHTMTQNPIKPGKSFTYEFDVHEEGTFFYHSHIPMQEAFGMVGWFIVHPKLAWDPPVDRDFCLIFQNFFIAPNQDTPDSWRMDWNWHTINGRSGPMTTPLVVKHGERVRIRIMNFSPMQHHPIHLHGHTFWLTGHEGARCPKSAWVPRNTELIGIAQATDFEFIANNPGDWMFHCHMVHHMMNHMVEQVGPRIRNAKVDRYLANLDVRPAAEVSQTAAGKEPPGYPQEMQGMEMSPEMMKRIWARREVQGMRSTFPMSLMGLMTVLRVLPADLYDRVMNGAERIEKDSIFQEIVKRFGDPKQYEAPPKMMHHH